MAITLTTTKEVLRRLDEQNFIQRVSAVSVTARANSVQINFSTAVATVPIVEIYEAHSVFAASDLVSANFVTVAFAFISTPSQVH